MREQQQEATGTVLDAVTPDRVRHVLCQAHDPDAPPVGICGSPLLGLPVTERDTATHPHCQPCWDLWALDVRTCEACGS